MKKKTLPIVVVVVALAVSVYLFLQYFTDKELLKLVLGGTITGSLVLILNRSKIRA